MRAAPRPLRPAWRSSLRGGPACGEAAFARHGHRRGLAPLHCHPPPPLNSRLHRDSHAQPAASLSSSLSSPPPSLLRRYVFVFGLSLIGGILFTIASYVGIIEVTHSRNPFALPEAGYSHGYVVAFCNFWGSVLFTIAGAFYYVEAELMNMPPTSTQFETGWWIKQILVRGAYAIGSALFMIGALFGFHEVLNNEED